MHHLLVSGSRLGVVGFKEEKRKLSLIAGGNAVKELQTVMHVRHKEHIRNQKVIYTLTICGLIA